MSISNSPTPPLLLTKRLSAFLHAHQSPQLPTLLLITSHGKLLAHASSLAVSLLRIHATVAASLLAIHTSSSVVIPAALPGGSPPEDAGNAVQPGTITVQLTGGTVVIRRLECGLLFVCVGPPAGEQGEGGDAHGQYGGGSSPSEAGSLVSGGGGGGEGGEAVAVVRRRAAELARRLDEKLGTLKVPGEGVGVEAV